MSVDRDAAPDPSFDVGRLRRWINRSGHYLGLHHGQPDDASIHWRFILPAATALCLATGALLWFGYVATRAWVQANEVAVEGRGREAAALAAAAIDRDIAGAASMLLMAVNQPALEQRPTRILQSVARTFASYPYPETVFVWATSPAEPLRLTAFNRAERMPPWAGGTGTEDPFPVVVLDHPAPLVPLIDAMNRQVDAQREFVAFETMIGDEPYQVVGRLVYDWAAGRRLLGGIAFTVNLRWVRSEYFAPILDQVEQIGQYAASVAFAVKDEHGTIVAQSASYVDRRPARARALRLMFINPDLLGRSPQARDWTVRVQVNSDGVLPDAGRTFALLSLTAVASVLALLITVRAVQARARVAVMKSDFVSAVTHELKTPVSVIRLVAETLSQSRYESAERVQTYAQMLAHEAGRLGQSIDQLLTYARYSDGRTPTEGSLDTVDLTEIVDEAMDNFRTPLREGGFAVTVDVPHGFMIHVDRKALIMALDSVLDNAIKYSDTHRVIRLSGAGGPRLVTLVVADRGVGIAREDLMHVFDRFYRGRNATRGGSGLGLAIARRIVRHHGGDVTLRSTEGVGTEVRLSVPTVDQP